ncbi:hypothetical protein LTR66_017625, partial [Elasticomyces elasticus]
MDHIHNPTNPPLPFLPRVLIERILHAANQPWSLTFNVDWREHVHRLFQIYTNLCLVHRTWHTTLSNNNLRPHQTFNGIGHIVYHKMPAQFYPNARHIIRIRPHSVTSRITYLKIDPFPTGPEDIRNADLGLAPTLSGRFPGLMNVELEVDMSMHSRRELREIAYRAYSIVYASGARRSSVPARILKRLQGIVVRGKYVHRNRSGEEMETEDDDV